MTRLLIRIFVGRDADLSDAGVRRRCGSLAGLMGLAVNFVLFAAKLVAGIYSGSISITADALNNLSDSAASVILLVGFKLSGKPADSDHPYGHGRAEYIAGLMVSFAVVVLGYRLIESAVGRILRPGETLFNAAVAAVLAASVAVKLWQYLFYRNIGRKIDSVAVMAAAGDSLSDVVATSGVLLAAVLSRLTGFILDGYVGAAVGLFIAVGGIRLCFQTISPLLGMAPSRELVDSIRAGVLKHDGVMGVHDLLIHTYGQNECFASLHCELPAEQDALESHELIDAIEREFLEKGIRLVIHPDPVVTGDEKADAIRQKLEAYLLQVSGGVGLRDFRVVRGSDQLKLIFDVAVPYKSPWTDTQLIRMITEHIRVMDVTYRAVITVVRADLDV